MRTITNLLFTLCLLSLSTAVFAQSAGTVTYVLTDQQGTTLAEANTSGSVTATFDYTPYGSIALGSSPKGPGYTGHVNDPETSLVYMQARYYDPATGRFLSSDPVNPTAANAFSFNRYSYANNNPVNHVDRDGKSVTCDADSCTIVAHSLAEVVLDYTYVGAVYLGRAVEVAVDRQESRSKPPAPLPEAGGLPHSIPDWKGGYTSYPNGSDTEGKQYRPTGKSHDNIPRPNVKEWEPNVAPDGTVHKGKGNVRPPTPDEVPGSQPNTPPTSPTTPPPADTSTPTPGTQNSTTPNVLRTNDGAPNDG